jgi:hypothetical protein
MARAINRLNARKVETLKTPGRHADGGNLYLSVAPSGAKSWTFLYRWHGTQKEIGIGSARAITLSRARELAAAHRAQLAEGLEPIGKRKAGRESDVFGGRLFADQGHASELAQREARPAMGGFTPVPCSAAGQRAHPWDRHQ